MKWYLKSLKQWRYFSGRASRKEFWMFWIFQIIFSLVFSLISYGVFNSNILYIVFFLFTFLPALALTVRRLHDVGQSGIWAYSPFPIIMISVIINNYFNIPDSLETGLGVFIIIFGIILLIFTAKKGEIGENMWGQNPLEITTKNNLMDNY